MAVTPVTSPSEQNRQNPRDGIFIKQTFIFGEHSNSYSLHFSRARKIKLRLKTLKNNFPNVHLKCLNRTENIPGKSIAGESNSIAKPTFKFSTHVEKIK